MRRLVLLGFRGTGKSAIGKKIAAMLEVPFYDTDALAEEQAGKTIPEIFSEDGEAAFRNLEHAIVLALPKENAVISTGGGIVLDSENIESLKRDSTCILLQASAAVIIERIRGTDRPPLTPLPLEKEVQELLQNRKRRYTGAADFCVHTDDNRTEDSAKTVLHLLKHGSVRHADVDTGLRFLKKTGLPAEDLEKIGRIFRGTGNPLTRLYAIVGNPCAHSKSPAMYNRLFSHYGLDTFYTRLEWSRIGEVMEEARRLDFRGLSITIPFKVDAIPYLDEVDEHAAAIGAVNTVVHCGGTMYGYNTDWLGVQRPLSHMKGSRAVLLGGGGAAAAAAYALTSLGMDLTILNRTEEKARVLAERFGCRAGRLDAIRRIPADLVVNATSVGMEPDTGTLLTAEDLPHGCTVFDLVYTPPETPLLREAKRAGCSTISGREMFLYQACEQFELFTGIAVPEELVREAIPK